MLCITFIYFDPWPNIGLSLNALKPYFIVLNLSSLETSSSLSKKIALEFFVPEKEIYHH